MIKSTPAPKVLHRQFLFVPYAYAVILAGLAVWQLVMFERFAPYIASYLGEGHGAAATIIAMKLIGAEIFALPFLLRMRLSKLARLLSAGCAFVVPLMWAAVTMWAPTFGFTHLALNILFFALGGASFWLLGGPKIIQDRLR